MLHLWHFAGFIGGLGGNADMFLEIRKEIGGIKPSLKTRNPRETIEPSIAVLVIACNRVDYIRRTLDELLK